MADLEFSKKEILNLQVRLLSHENPSIFGQMLLMVTNVLHLNSKNAKHHSSVYSFSHVKV